MSVPQASGYAPYLAGLYQTVCLLFLMLGMRPSNLSCEPLLHFFDDLIFRIPETFKVVQHIVSNPT